MVLEKNVPSHWSLIRLGTVVLEFWKHVALDFPFKGGKSNFKMGMMVELQRDKEVGHQHIYNIPYLFSFFNSFYLFC